ncbi:hypothetical protein DZ761_07280 [Enterococcus faecium]|nr:hypothetical protein [Enterococcus faecium]EGP5591850.1 hypothetical protein [Enterococcus faecium]
MVTLFYRRDFLFSIYTKYFTLSVLLIYSMFLLSWIYVISENKDITFLQIFEQSAWKVFFDFLRNILCCVLLLGFVLLIFLFPPFIFIFAGGVWKLVSIILTIGNER